jgi:hypothetical protein
VTRDRLADAVKKWLGTDIWSGMTYLLLGKGRSVQSGGKQGQEIASAAGLRHGEVVTFSSDEL